LPGFRFPAFRAGLPGGGCRPGRSSAGGGIEEFPLLREISRSSRSTLASRSPITASRAAQASAGGRLVTSHHDHDIRNVIKPTRWGDFAKITTAPDDHTASANATQSYRS
jgi:hypothetical protein